MVKFIKIAIINPEDGEETGDLYLNPEAIESMTPVSSKEFGNAHSLIILRERDDNILCTDNPEEILRKIRMLVE